MPAFGPEEPINGEPSTKQNTAKTFINLRSPTSRRAYQAPASLAPMHALHVVVSAGRRDGKGVAMTRIRAKCPSCGDVEFGVMDIVIVGDAVQTAHAYRFWCPTCDSSVSRSAVSDVIELLFSAGVRLEPWSDSALATSKMLHPSAPPITDADIERFREQLGSPDWFASLQDNEPG